MGTADTTRPNPKQFDKKKFVTCVLNNNWKSIFLKTYNRDVYNTFDTKI